jgi:sarcosine oxidase subunit gamma
MAEGLPTQGALAHRGLGLRETADPGGAGVRLTSMPFRLCINLRAEATPEIRTILTQNAGCGLPVQPLDAARRGGTTTLWLGPDEWLIVTGEGGGGEGGGGDGFCARLEAAFRGHFVTVTDVSDAWCVIRLAGPAAAEVLAKGCGLDIHDRVFPPGKVARSLLAKANVILHRLKPETFEIYVARSYADYLWRWLEDAGAEFGVAVVAAA